MTYYGIGLEGVHLPFNFQLLQCDWNARAICDLVRDYEAMLPEGGWPNWVLGNHDNHRIATRVGAAQARVAAMLLLTLRGTPTMYYGDEIGMQDGIIRQSSSRTRSRSGCRASASGAIRRARLCSGMLRRRRLHPGTP